MNLGSTTNGANGGQVNIQITNIIQPFEITIPDSPPAYEDIEFYNNCSPVQQINSATQNYTATTQ